jgi:hypothetical protein
MFIGDPQTFAIECYHDPISNETRRVFGRMCIHSGGNVLGDITEPACMLNVTESHLESVMGTLSLLDDPTLSNKNDLEMFELLDRSLYRGDNRTNAEVAMDAKRYRKFDFLTNGGGSFDDTKSFIIHSGDHVRILFTGRDDKLQSIRVHTDVFRKVMGDFLKWLKKEGENVPV